MVFSFKCYSSPTFNIVHMECNILIVLYHSRQLNQVFSKFFPKWASHYFLGTSSTVPICWSLFFMFLWKAIDGCLTKLVAQFFH